MQNLYSEMEHTERNREQYSEQNSGQYTAQYSGLYTERNRGQYSGQYTEQNRGQYTEQYNKQEIVYAGFWVRLAAYVLDYVLVFFILLLARLLFLPFTILMKNSGLDGNVLFQYSWKDIMLYGVQVLYFILCTYCTGTTLGKRAFNLRVISAKKEKKLSLWDVVYRETVGRFLSGLAVGIGYLMAAIDKEKRGLHDILADTRVVYGVRMKVYPIYKPMPQPVTYQPVPPAATVGSSDMKSPEGQMQASGTGSVNIPEEQIRAAGSSYVNTPEEPEQAARTDYANMPEAQVEQTRIPPSQEE